MSVPLICPLIVLQSHVYTYIAVCLSYGSVYPPCHRLKGLLPQTEVTSTYFDPKPRLQKINKKRANGKSARNATTTESDEDGWSTGDESIDQFTSSGEQLSVESTAFSHSQNQDKHVILPSLIPLNETEASPPPSTDSATLGSLKQSPIDLSLGSPSSGPASQAAVTDTCLSTSTGLSSTDESTNNSSQLPYSNVSDVPDEGVAVQIKEEHGCKLEKVPVAEEENDDWCLKYECSPSGANTASTPPAKKARLSQTVSRKLFKGELSSEPGQQEEASPPHASETHSSFPSFVDLTCDDQTSEESDCVPVLEPSPEMIDLTYDCQVPSELHCNTLSRGHNKADNTLCTGTCTNTVQKLNSLAPPTVVELSDSQGTGSTVGSRTGRRSASVESGSGQDPFGSPSCLPPTPGRENVCSILQRPDFP